VEAAHSWYRDLTETFEENGYEVSKRENDMIEFCGTIVDDCLFICNGEKNGFKTK
jgi:hypothetical protein